MHHFMVMKLLICLMWISISEHINFTSCIKHCVMCGRGRRYVIVLKMELATFEKIEIQEQNVKRHHTLYIRM